MASVVHTQHRGCCLRSTFALQLPRVSVPTAATDRSETAPAVEESAFPNDAPLCVERRLVLPACPGHAAKRSRRLPEPPTCVTCLWRIDTVSAAEHCGNSRGQDAHPSVALGLVRDEP